MLHINITLMCRQTNGLNLQTDTEALSHIEILNKV